MTQQSTHQTYPWMHSNDIDVRNLPDGFDLVDAIRQLSQDPNLACPWSWTLSHLHDDVPWYQQPALIVGVRNASTGALTWDDAPVLVPATGTNTEPVDYWIAGAHHMRMEAGAEVPAPVVLDAVAEYLRTGVRLPVWSGSRHRDSAVRPPDLPVRRVPVSGRQQRQPAVDVPARTVGRAG